MQQKPRKQKSQSGKAKEAMPKKHAQKPGMKRSRNGVQIPPIAEYKEFKAIPSVVTRTGKDSAIISFCQPLTTIKENLGANNCFANGSLAETYSTNSIVFGPSTLNGPLLNNAQPWSEFRFRRVKLVYHPACPSTTSGAFAVGVSFQQPVKAAGDLSSFATIQSVTIGYNGCYWKSWELNVPLEDPGFKRVDYEISGSVQDVLGAPFTLCGRNSEDGLSTVVRGYITIHGEIEVRNAIPVQGVTFQVRSKSDRNLMVEAYKLLCPAPIHNHEPEVPSEAPQDELVRKLSEIFKQTKVSSASSVGSGRSWQ